MDKTSQAYLNSYLDKLDPEVRESYTSYSSGHFCNDEYNANNCAALILKGQKTATCSMEYWYSQKGEPMPAPADLHVVTNWSGEPVCIIEVTSVVTSRYIDVTPEFAHAEGEGDRSLEWWRKAHWQFFTKECEELEIEPTETMLLVLERFKVVHS